MEKTKQLQKISFSFSRKEAFSFGWKSINKNFWKFLPLIIIFIVLIFIPGIVAGLLTAINQGDQIIKSLIIGLQGISQFFSLIFTISFLKIGLEFVDSGQVSYRKILYHPWLLIKYIISSTIFISIFYLGLFLLVVPGVYWSMRLQFYSLFLIEGNGPIESLKRSWQITRKQTWPLFVFCFLLGLINLLGIFALIIGMFWTLPLALLAWINVYRQLERNYKSNVIENYGL